TALVRGKGIMPPVASGAYKGLGVAETSQVGTSFDGETFDTTAVVVGYTYLGDVDLNGVINIRAYTRMDQGNGAGSTGWYNGDLNLDGKVNIQDYVIIDQNLNTQGAAL